MDVLPWVTHTTGVGEHCNRGTTWSYWTGVELMTDNNDTDQLNSQRHRSEWVGYELQRCPDCAAKIEYTSFPGIEIVDDGIALGNVVCTNADCGFRAVETWEIASTVRETEGTG